MKIKLHMNDHCEETQKFKRMKDRVNLNTAPIPFCLLPLICFLVTNGQLAFYVYNTELKQLHRI